VSALADEVFDLAATVVEALGARAEPAVRRLPVCKAGCSSCCKTHAVLVTPVEALRIAAHVRATRDAEGVAVLLARLEAVGRRTALMNLKERAESRLPCPLLHEATGACTVHPARPIVCRGYNSLDASFCERALEAGDPAARPPANLDQAAACRHVFAGLALGGAANGREPGPFELVAALRCALSTHDAESRWLAGEPIFADARTLVGDERDPEWRAFVLQWSSRLET
jgi:Fe-S-cluster containining protein